MLHLAGTAMGEIEPDKIIHWVNITVVGWHGYGRGRAHNIFREASITVDDWLYYG